MRVRDEIEPFADGRGEPFDSVLQRMLERIVRQRGEDVMAKGVEADRTSSIHERENVLHAQPASSVRRARSGP
jgi:hypothetical protein